MSLIDLGSHPLRDLPRPERVVQVCHPDLRNDFPPLRTSERRCRAQSSSATDEFVGRQAANERACGMPGRQPAGDTDRRRRGRQDPPGCRVAAERWQRVRRRGLVRGLAPITDPEVVPVTVARALGLPDQPGRSTMDTLLRFIGDRRMLLVLDNCEHLLDASAELVVELLGGAPS